MTANRTTTSSKEGAGLVAAEFFAGMGLMRAALDRCGIETVFANDVDKTKALLYAENWGDGELRLGAVPPRPLHNLDVAIALRCLMLSV